MELFDDGGFRDQGNTKDPVSNNPVPVGSTQEEVRDDIPANLSEGEFVLPADVVRYHGLEKIMGIRDQAKTGLQKMENMGQMGNSDQATMPDGTPFKQMAVGGVVPPTVQQPQVVTQNTVPGVQYVAPTTQALRPSVYNQTQQVPQVNVPTQPTVNVPTAPSYQAPAYRQPTNTAATPQFSNLLGTQFGQLQESVTKKYVNSETGEEMYIPFVNGEPIYPIPTGFIAEEDVAKKAQDEDINKAVRSTSVRQQEQDSGENPDNFNKQEKDYKVAMQVARDDEAIKRANGEGSMLGNILNTVEKVFQTGIVGQVIDKFNRAMDPNMTGVDAEGNPKYFDRMRPGPQLAEAFESDRTKGAKASNEALAKASGYESLVAMSKQYGVQPTFKFGTEPGDVSLVTGKPYNFAGQSKQRDGTIAYSGWKYWTEDLSDGYDTGWGGGFETEAEIQASIAANDDRANRNISGYTHSRDGGWDRSKVDNYKDLKAEKAGGYIDKTMVDGKKGPNYGNFVKGKPTDSSITNLTKSKVTPTVNKASSLFDPGVTSTPSSKADRAKATRVDRAKQDAEDDIISNYNVEKDNYGGESSITSLDASSTFSDTTDQSPNNDDQGPGEQAGDTSYSGSGVGGWTAKGGFINKRTMTMSKVSPNKKKRGGLASRK